MPTYLEELAEWVEKRDSRRKGRQDKHLVAFLAAKEDIRAALEKGYTLHTVWEHMREKSRIGYSYDTFIRHVRQHLKGVRNSRKREGPAPATGCPPTEKPAAARAAAGFVFNPHPRREDLL